jgi:beta-glucosidase
MKTTVTGILMLGVASAASVSALPADFAWGVATSSY